MSKKENNLLMLEKNIFLTMLSLRHKSNLLQESRALTNLEVNFQIPIVRTMCLLSYS